MAKIIFWGRDESSGELKSFFVGPDDSESNDDYSVISISVVSSTASSAVPSVEIGRASCRERVCLAV